MTQGLVVSGFSSLPTGRALFLEFTWKDGTQGNGQWLDALQTVAPVSDADSGEVRSVALAFTWVGLKKMGLPQAGLESFSAPFQEGMMQEDRLRRLGDRRSGKWLDTVIPGGPVWSANTPQRGEIEGVAYTQFANLTATGHPEEQIQTPKTVHALLLLYAASETEADDWATKHVVPTLAARSVQVVRTLPLDLRFDANGIAREHFGFSDGISQPIPYDPGALVLSDGNAATERDKWNGVPLGEILIGHVNGHHEVAPGPAVPPLNGSTTAAANLPPPHPLAEGMLDFGLDGSYMVVRELKQNVAAFWKSMDDAAASICSHDPKNTTHVDATWLAERVVGRDLDGNLLCPAGKLTPPEQLPNDFAFRDRDPYGAGCPLGSHVRRGNPRDGLASKPQDKQTLLEAANNHRILRRGRKFGPTVADPRTDDGADRGLLFICLNTDIARQFEFVQQTWMLNPNFATLYDETDPLIGPKGKMTVRDQSLRRRIDVDTFVHMVGGEYFFLPSIPALRYLAAL